jgi:hypothetical protein
MVAYSRLSCVGGAGFACQKLRTIEAMKGKDPIGSALRRRVCLNPASNLNWQKRLVFLGFCGNCVRLFINRLPVFPSFGLLLSLSLSKPRASRLLKN